MNKISPSVLRPLPATTAILMFYCCSSSLWAACPASVATLVAAIGAVELQRADAAPGWRRAALEPVAFCPGDGLRVLASGRAVLYLPDEQTLLQVEANTSLIFTPRERGWLELLQGALGIFSRQPQNQLITTPFFNAATEGTEFVVRVAPDQGSVQVLEGRVRVFNDIGQIVLGTNERAVAGRGEAPRRVLPLDPVEAVQWAIYYPPLVDLRPDGLAPVYNRVLARYGEGDVETALAALAALSPAQRDDDFAALQAALLLTIGRVDEAQAALADAPESSAVLAQAAVIALAQNRRDQALALAQRGLALEQRSPVALTALAYVQQGRFDLDAARVSAAQALAQDPDNLLLLARLAELELALGNARQAEALARRAQGNSRGATILGFALLARGDGAAAQPLLAAAVAQAGNDPLARLGLGLAKIRQGELSAGRRELEIAVGLDPVNALLRSYLGKAYAAEGQATAALNQFSLAQGFDEQDPTAWFYQAIVLLQQNRPVEALQAAESSIVKNDNRAVYRSQLLLAEDATARSATLGRIYDRLEFEALAVQEGAISIAVDPTNPAAHRLLADGYLGRPRHEIARASEILQTQLQRPLSLNLTQPQLSQTDLGIPQDAGPATAGINEYTPLFLADQSVAAQFNSLVGSANTFGNDLVVAGLVDRFAVSLSQFHYSTDGYQPNSDLTQNIVSGFVQYAPHERFSVQMEHRYRITEQGERSQRLVPTPDFFRNGFRLESESYTGWLGLRYDLSSRSQLLLSGFYNTNMADIPFVATEIEAETINAEGLLSWRGDELSLIGGVSYNWTEEQSKSEVLSFESGMPTVVEVTSQLDGSHYTGYLYAHWNLSKPILLTLGAGLDVIDNDRRSDTLFSPKLGVIWRLLPGTTLRAAAFQTVRRLAGSVEQTIEPTSIAGFNQLYDDSFDAKSRRYGVGIDQKLMGQLYGGLEYSQREAEAFILDQSTEGADSQSFDIDEELLRAYLYLPVDRQTALAAEYQWEGISQVIGGAKDLYTHRFKLSLQHNRPSGLFAKVDAQYVNQRGDVEGFTGEFDETFNPITVDVGLDEEFWLFGLSVGYRKNNTQLSLMINNLFNTSFRYEEVDGDELFFVPERQVFIRGAVLF